MSAERDLRLRQGGGASLLVGAGVAVLAVALTTLLLYPLTDLAPVESLGVVYLVAVLLVSSLWGARLGIATAVGGAAAFNFFHIPPTGRFTISEGENWVALGDVVETTALRRSDSLKTALLRAVSHDLRSPLTAILTAKEALRSPSLSPAEHDELVADIGTEAMRLSRLIDNLLDLSRLEAQAAEPHRTWCSLEEVIRAAVDDLDLPPGTFSLSLDHDLPQVRADAAQLERAFANLLENASRYSGGHPVSVRARDVGSRAPRSSSRCRSTRRRATRSPPRRAPRRRHDRPAPHGRVRSAPVSSRVVR